MVKEFLNRKKVLVILVLLLVISNIYFYNKASDYSQINDSYYRSSVNELYGGIYDLERALDQVLKQENNPNHTTLTAYTVRARNAIWDAQQAAGHMGLYLRDQNQYQFTTTDISYLFGMVLSYQANDMEVAINDESSEVYQLAKLLKEEITIIRENLPQKDKEYINLSNGERTNLWVKIINELPENEYLDYYMNWINADTRFEGIGKSS